MRFPKSKLYKFRLDSNYSRAACNVRAWFDSEEFLDVPSDTRLTRDNWTFYAWNYALEQDFAALTGNPDGVNW